MANDNFPNGYALIIGVGNDLPDTVNDANVLHKILIDPKKAGYPSAQAQLITGKAATKQGIVDALIKLDNQTKDNTDATVLIYYSGHGAQVMEPYGEQYYLVPNDYSPPNKKALLTKKELSELINQINSQKMMLIFDCCHANGVKGVDFDKMNSQQDFQPLVEGLSAGSGRVVIASCQKNESSYIDRQKNHGIFTSVLIETLEGKNTMDKKKYISFEDICQYLRTEVPIRANELMKKPQTPVFNLTDFTGFDVCFNSYVPPTPCIFIISDSQDNQYLEAISNSLKVLERRNLIEKWDISRIPSGAIVKDVLNEKIDKSDIILGLISTNYLNSDVCLRLQTRAVADDKTFVPILLEDCLYELEEEITKREGLPKKQGQLTAIADDAWSSQNAAYAEISRGILRLVQSRLVQ
jgi:Caspase domain/TIR domain